jgi:hypothetical protein
VKISNAADRPSNTRRRQSQEVNVYEARQRGSSADYSSVTLFCQSMMVILIEKLKKESKLD